MQSLYKPTARNVLKNTFWLFFDNLGKFIKLNLLFILTSIPIVTLPAAFAGLLYSTKLIIEKKESSTRDYFRGMKIYGPRISILFVLILVLLAITTADVSFYLKRPGVLSFIINGWIVVFAVLSMLLVIYILPLLLLDNKIIDAIKKAWILTLKNYGFTVRVFLLGALIKICFLLTAVPVLLFIFSFLAAFLNHTYIEVSAQYTGQVPRSAEGRSIVEEFLVPPRE